MTPQEFVSQLRIEVVSENTTIYRGLFSNTPIEEASDPYWKRALELFGNLSPGEKEVFFEVIRQVAVDTTSNVLGLIDGVNSLHGISGELELRLGGKKLSGDLQSLFLVEEERSPK
jgi:hypothetical protein